MGIYLSKRSGQFKRYLPWKSPKYASANKHKLMIFRQSTIYSFLLIKERKENIWKAHTCKSMGAPRCFSLYIQHCFSLAKEKKSKGRNSHFAHDSSSHFQYFVAYQPLHLLFSQSISGENFAFFLMQRKIP